MNRLWTEFQHTLSLELGPELTSKFVAPLFSETKGSVEQASRKYFDIGIIWAAIITHWRNWVAKNAIGPPVLVMRDAKPLTVAPLSSSWARVWLNRKSCGIQDQISGDFEEVLDPLVCDYLKQHRLHEYFTFVDSGCWGTIVKELHSLGLKFKPLFFFSHNPNIPGFLNELGVEEKCGEVLNDSFECCFPNMVIRPSSFTKDATGRIVPSLKNTDELSVILGRMAMEGVRIGTLSLNGDCPPVADAVQSIIMLSEKARKGEFTGILPENSPTWPEGQKFLSEWPEKLCWT